MPQPFFLTSIKSSNPLPRPFHLTAPGRFVGRVDFHLGRDGPKLIEINTNAGGALINAYLLQAQRACCGDMAAGAAVNFNLSALLAEFMSNFEKEWQRQGRVGPLRSIAIVDQSPERQYLYPEFVLFQRLFEAHGLTAVIAAPEDLSHRDNALWCGEKPSTSSTIGLPISISNYPKARCCERPIWQARSS